MVHTINAIVTATLALGAAAPILAAPVERRIDSGFSSVNSRAPILPPSSGVGSVGSGTPAPVLYLISGHNLTSRATDDELYVAARAPVGTAEDAPPAYSSDQPLPNQPLHFGQPGFSAQPFGSLDTFMHDTFAKGNAAEAPAADPSNLLEPKPAEPATGSIDTNLHAPDRSEPKASTILHATDLSEPKVSTSLPNIASVFGRDLEDIFARSFGIDELD